MVERRGLGFGFRKAILINEHFVVYGVPAVALPLRRRVRVSLEVGPGRGLEMSRVFGEGGAARESAAGDESAVEALREVLRSLGLSEEDRRYRFICLDDLPGWSGLGSSAAFCVASARAVCQALGIAISEEGINRVAFEGEKVFAGNPSGIDNTVATYGRAIRFRRGEHKPWTFLGAADLPLVVGNSGFPSLTSEQVAKVARYRETNLARFEGVCREAEEAAQHVCRALEARDLATLGRWMDRAQGLLEAIGVSCRVLNDMVDACRRHGALGAKLTGAGGGGCMLALAADDPGARHLAGMLHAMGCGAFTVRPGREPGRESGQGG